MNNKKKLFKHQLLITAISVFGVVLAMVGGSFALFTSTSKADEYNVLKAGNFELSYVDTGAGYGDVLSLNGAYPMSDTEGKKTDAYRFNITNTGTVAADFKIKLLYDDSIIQEDGCQDKLLLQQYVKYQFDNNEPVLLSATEASDYVIYEATDMSVGASEIHEIRIWISSDAPNSVLGKHFHGKLVVEGVQSGTEKTVMSSKTSLSVGDSVTAIDGSKWHVLEASASGTETVVLLSDYNLNSDGSYNTTCGVEINGEYECSMMAFDTDDTNTYDENDSNNIGYFIKNTYAPKVIASLPGTTNITLPTAHQIAIADGQIYNSGNLELMSSWLGKIDYWTTTISTVSVLLVEESYIVDGYTPNNVEAGARPVITTPKTNLLVK